MNEKIKLLVENYGKEYVKKLIIQFANAKGITNVDLNSEMFVQEFLEWLNELSNSGGMYLSLLEYMDFEINSPYYAEVGKGKEDTLFSRSKTTLITPYTSGLHSERGGFIIPGTVDLEDSQMVMNISGNNGEEVSKVKDLSSLFSGMMVHNPYDGFGNWEQFLANPEMGIACGVFGKTSDKDIESKRKLLEDMKAKIESCKEESVRINDTYCHILVNYPVYKMKVKEKENENRRVH